STMLAPLSINPHGYAPYDLKADAGLRREMKAAMRATGVSISLAEGVLVVPGVDARDRLDDLDVFAELGATRVNLVSLDPDLARPFDQFARLAELVAERGMHSTTEFAPGLTIANLGLALEAVRFLGRDDFRLVIDTMHLIRSGSSAEELAALDPNLI